ncbi:MAG: hypothetical protein R3B53_03155 [Candidatus Paceibacterota bacterium]
MKKLLVLLSAALLVVSAAQASPILATITHDYGSGVGQVAPSSLGAGTCDTLNVNTVTIRSASNCQRFYDTFDLSGVMGIIDSFTLTMDFTGARNETLGLERWAPRPASSATNGSLQVADLMAASGPQSWVFDATNLDVFNDILASKQFVTWFSREALFGNNSVNVDYITLQVSGTPDTVNSVPNPGTLPLLGLAFSGMFIPGALKRAQAKHKAEKLAALGHSRLAMNVSPA